VKRVGWFGRCSAAVVFAGVAAATTTQTLAQTSADRTDTAQSAELRAFSIPPQPLATAVGIFGQQSGRQVTVDGALIRGFSTPGVQGTMSVDEALRRLLAGTGLVATFPSATTITLQRPGQSGAADPGTIHLDPVQVQGYAVPSQAMIDNIPPPYAGGQVATGSQLGLLGNRSVMDTPFNQTSYTAKTAQDQQARTVRDVLLNDPSVRFSRSDSGPGFDQVTIRGFTVDAAAWSYGGLYGMLPLQSPMAEMAERIEVLKGPSLMLNGMAPYKSIGGMVNIVPKRAPDEDLTRVVASYGSAGQGGGHVDVARRFSNDKEFGVRFNGVLRAGQTDLQYNSDQRALALAGLDYRGNGIRLSADLGIQSQYIAGLSPYIALAAGVQLPYAPSARSNPTAQPWGFQSRQDAFAVGRAEVDIADKVTAYVAVGGHDNRLGGVYSPLTTILSVAGTARANAPFNISTYNTFFTAEGGIRGNFETGPIGHELAVTATTYSQETGSGTVVSSIGPFATNIYGPTTIGQPTIVTPAANKISTAGLSSVGFADTLSAAEKRIQLTVGGRAQTVSGTNYNAVSGAPVDYYNQSAFSPSVSLVFKPWENVSLYGNWIQGLQQGTTVQPPFTNAGQIFPPFVSTQYEVGVKADWGKLTTTASLFQISQPSILTNLANNTQYLGGEQVNQGLELNVFGEPIKGFRVLGGAMFLNPVLTKTQGGTTDGWIAPFSPQFTLNLGSEIDVPFVRGLTFLGRALYTSAQYIDTTYPRRSLPDWTRFDVGVRYAFENPGATGKMLVARLNVENVLDANYWSGANETANFMFLGAPRTFRLSLTADF